MKTLPQEFIILEIIPNHSDSTKGFLVQVQALMIKEKQIVKRLDLRVREDLIDNPDLLRMISYDKELFKYVEKEDLMKEFLSFIGDKPLLIIDNQYTLDYLKDIKNLQESIFPYLELEMSNDVFNELINKYQLEPSNHLVDLLYEALIFANNK